MEATFKLVMNCILANPGFAAKETQVRREKINCLKLQKGY